MTLEELREEAKDAGIKNYWSKGEDKLIAELNELKNEQPEEKPEEKIIVEEEVIDDGYEYEETTSIASSGVMQSEGWIVYEMPRKDGVLTHKLKRKLNG